jgi:hypothetical protein
VRAGKIAAHEAGSIMIKIINTLCILIQLAQLSSLRVNASQTKDLDVLKWIDPLIGSRNGGNVFAGATLPYGMAKGQ